MSNPLFKPRQQPQAPALQLALRPREAAAALGAALLERAKAAQPQPAPGEERGQA